MRIGAKLESKTHTWCRFGTYTPTDSWQQLFHWAFPTEERLKNVFFCFFGSNIAYRYDQRLLNILLEQNRETVVWRDSSGGSIDRLDLGRAITTLITVTRRGLVITSLRTTRPPRHNHLSPRRTQSPARRFPRVKAYTKPSSNTMKPL
ncbi:hypothetical protein Y032_0127g1414 [Ancylostoma ceylanicum]|uniref:Uncharacterized protein n=1 Tax=Ancylostoma ceylanicum TaxID=53326 RepID=A0A016T897_9BILA|nr:hypothetical protein Y032_0127g1414 [Ancylostoma ceylanicum]